MKRIARGVSVALCAAVLAFIAHLVHANRADRSNYTVNPAITRQVIELFDALGTKPDEVNLGGGTNGAAVGTTGMGSVMQFVLEGRREMLGVHLLQNHDRTVIRFSLPPDGNSPFETKDLSSSLAEDEQLQRSFESLLKRLEKIDPLRSLSLRDWVASAGKQGN